MVIYVTLVTFQMAFVMNNSTNVVINDGMVQLLAKSPTFSCQQLAMDDWNLDEESLRKWHKFQHYKSIIP